MIRTVFNTYSRSVGRNNVTIVNGEVTNNLRYADDKVLIADSAEGLQRPIYQVVKIGKQYTE